MPKEAKVKYAKDQLEAALKEVQRGNNISVRSIATKYGVPRSSLRFKIKHPGHKNTLGPSTVLTSNEENLLVKWIIAQARKGFPKKRDDVVSSVQQFLIKDPRLNPFINNRPGEGWWKAFLKRHPQLTERISEGVTKASSCVSEKDIRGWFKEVEEYIKEKKLEDVIANSSRIFNCDETNILICPATGKVIAEKGAKNVYSIEQGNVKESLTVLFTFSASGKTCCPMIIYPYQRIPDKVIQSVPHNWGIGKSDNGWMTAETFYEFIANVFHPYLESNEVQRPIILFVDGHKTHLTYNLSILCTELQIEVIALYPNATRILQPADVAAFRPLKLGWRKRLQQWQSEHPMQALSKLTFAKVLEEVVGTCFKADSLINGFRICGLCPFNPDSVDYTKCLGSSSRQIDINKPDEHDNVTISYKSFVDTVGEDILNKFEQIDNILEEPDHEYLLKLFMLWKKFQFNEAHTQKNTTRLPLLNNRVQDVTSNGAQPSEIQNNKTIAFQSTSKNNNAVWKENKFHSREISPPLEQVIIAPEVTPGISKEKRVILKSKDSCYFGKYLPWPESPVRKGKKSTEREPFAITSLKYKLSLQKKKENKQQLLKEKEERKRKREENKVHREQIIKKSKGKGKGKKAQPGKQITVLNDVIIRKASDLCSICKMEVVQDVTTVLCDMCKHYTHVSCIPKVHQENIPECQDIDIYICQKCYKLHDTSDDSLSDSQLFKMCKESHF